MQNSLIAKSSQFFCNGFEKTLQSANSRVKMSQFYLMLFLHLSNKEAFLEHLETIKKFDAGRFKPQELLEGMWSLSLCLEALGDSGAHLTKLYHETLVELAAKGIVDRLLLIERLPDQTLYDSKLVESAAHQKRVSRQFTKINLMQNKYNLLKENNEGYSKVLILLLGLKSKDSPKQVYEALVSLIGHFDLDPDRVLDLVIENYIQNPAAFSVYSEILFNFERSSIPPLLGDKFSKIPLTELQAQKLVTFESVDSFISQGYEKMMREANIPTYNLVAVSALLIKRGLLKLEQVVPHLLPSDKFMQHDAERRVAQGQAKFNQTFVISTEQLTEKQKKELEEKQKTEFFGQYLYNTKLWLLNELVAVNDWHHFRQLWYLYGSYVDLIVHQPLLSNLYRILEWSLDKLYRSVSLAQHFNNLPGLRIHNFETTEQFKAIEIPQFNSVTPELFDYLEEIFGVIKQYIGFNTQLYVKLCRFLISILSQDARLQISQTAIPNMNSRILRLVKLYFLPGLNCQRCNPTLEMELFPLLQKYDFKERFECYEYNYCGAMLSNPYFAREFAKVKKEQNVLFNTLSKENKKQYLKRVGKLATNHSFYVFYWVTSRMLLEDYQSMVPDIVNVLGNCTKVALEAFAFIILYTMTQQKQPIVDIKTGQVSVWFKNCYIFLSLFYKKFYDTDLMPVFYYILSKLNRPIKDIESLGQLQTMELRFFKEILSKMYGYKFVEDYNKSQLASMAAGPRLMFEAYDLTNEIRAAKKSASELEDFFWKKSINYYSDESGKKYSMAFFLMVVIAQKRTETISKSLICDLKILAQVYDEYTSSLTQFIKILTFMSENPDHYGKLLPANSLEGLILNFKVPIELAFAIVRPSYRNINSMSPEEWNNTVKSISGTIQHYLKADRTTLMLNGYLTGKPGLVQQLEAYKQRFRKVMSYEMYAAFWLLTLDGVFYPKKTYDEKIEELKRKISGWKNNERGGALMDKELEKTKNLFEKLNKESDLQRRKYEELMVSANKARFKLDAKISMTNDKKDKIVDKLIDEQLAIFAEVLTQTCLLPRLLLEPSEALYCAKFVILLIQINQLNSIRSVKMISAILEYTISYLPSATIKESGCLTIFVSELLNIFANWSDPSRLKDDFITKLATDESLIKDNYTKMKEYLIKIFEKIANYIKLNKEEPYIIKNSLYLLHKLEVIPAFKQQAESLEMYVRELKETYGKYKDMEPLLLIYISILDAKKKTLPDRPDGGDKKKPQYGQPINIANNAPTINPSALISLPNNGIQETIIIEEKKPVLNAPSKLKINDFSGRSVPSIYRTADNNTPTREIKREQPPASLRPQQNAMSRKQELEKGEIPETASVVVSASTSPPVGLNRQKPRHIRLDDVPIKTPITPSSKLEQEGQIQIRAEKVPEVSSATSTAPAVPLVPTVSPTNNPTTDDRLKNRQTLLQKIKKKENQEPKEEKSQNPASSHAPSTSTLQINVSKRDEPTRESRLEQQKPNRREDAQKKDDHSKKDQSKRDEQPVSARRDGQRRDDKDRKEREERREQPSSKEDNRREETRKDEQSRQEQKRDESRREQSRRDRRDDGRKEDTRKEDTKRDEGRGRDERRNDEKRRQDQKEKETKKTDEREPRRGEEVRKNDDKDRKEENRREDRRDQRRDDKREEKRQDRRDDKREDKRDEKREDKREPTSNTRAREEPYRREDKRDDRGKISGDIIILDSSNNSRRDQPINSKDTSKQYYSGSNRDGRDNRRSRSREGNKHRR